MSIERYGHGGDIWTASELYGVDKNQFLDFSSNMNPLGPPSAVGRILREEWERELVRYPDPACRELRAALAERYGIPADSILIGNGAAEVIDLALRALQPRTAGLLRPCFSEYEEAAQRAGTALAELQLRADEEFKPPSETPEWADAELLFLGHPNNPTGRLLSQEWIDGLLREGKKLILDEAFIDFSRDERERTQIRRAPESYNLLVVRSMTKFYSIPGLRLGFIVGHPLHIERMRRLQVQWSVNGLAQRVGAEVLADRTYEEKTLDWLYLERPWLMERLEELGLRVFPSDTNYLLFALEEAESFSMAELQQQMARRGILIRDASTFAGLSPLYGRTAIKLRDDNMKLIEGLRGSLDELRRCRAGTTGGKA